MITNLPEAFLYDRLPEALVTLDERGVISAVVGGIQDRLDDLRSYSRKLQFFFDPNSLPDGDDNVVLADLVSDQGVVYTRSIDFTEETPPDGTTALVRWAAQQLGKETTDLANVRYGRDLLRLVDTNTVAYLAETIGAILYETEITTAADSRRIVSSYFPRLKIKGTALSFEVLGRILGFDDLVFIPLWGRVSPRLPTDPGSTDNDPDFAPLPEYWPQQVFGPFYQPHVMRDGAFYTWAGTVSNGTASTSYYPQVVNGFNPFIDVVILGSLSGTNLPSITSGTVTHPANGNYALSGGAPHAKAYVEPPGSSLRFRAIAEGDNWNGLVINVCDAGSRKAITISDRLSTLKYRTSYFDVTMAADIDTAGDVFGERSAQPNKDLIVNPTLTPDGTAISPYRAWIDGSITTGIAVTDWLTVTGTNPPSVIEARHQAAGTNREMAFDHIVAAGVQVAQAMEEVRPATRFPRHTGAGLLINEDAHYACYLSDQTLFVTDGTEVAYTGSHPRTILPGYVALVDFHPGPVLAVTWPTTPGREYIVLGTPDFITYGTFATLVAESGSTTTFYVAITGTAGFFFPRDVAAGTLVASSDALINGLNFSAHQELDTADSEIGRYRYLDAQVTNLQVTGSYNFTSGSYRFDFLPGTPADVRVDVRWIATDTEVIRDEPTYSDKFGGSVTCQVRPEDDEDNPPDEVADEYPWLRAVVGGGELMEADSYITENNAVAVDVVDETASVMDQAGVPHEVYAIQSNSGYLRLTERVQADVAPGRVAVGYRGVFKDLSAYSATDHALVNGQTDLETVFEPGFAIYPVGLVQGVLVADPAKFFGPHQRTGLVGWWPFNEHVDDDLRAVDRSAVATNLVFSNVPYTNRIWDPDRGWYLNVPVGGTLVSQAYRQLADDVTVSFWVNLGVSAGVGTTTILELGPISFDLSDGGGGITGYARQAGGSRLAIGSYVGSGWVLISLRKTSTTAHFGFATSSATMVETEVDDTFLTATPDNQGLVVRSGLRPFGIHDLRIWNVFKTVEELELVRDYAPTPTVVNYRLSWIYSVNRQDRYGLRVLSNGWVTPAVLSPALRSHRQLRVRRYTSTGSYVGLPAYKEVGLGGGVLTPEAFGMSAYPLGYVFPYQEANGTIVVAGTNGLLPGVNSLWLTENAYPNYIALSGGSTASGSLTAYGTSAVSGTFWPSPQTLTNPCRDAIWIHGDDGLVYEVRMSGNATTTQLTATLTGRYRTDAEIAVNPIYAALIEDGTYWNPPISGTLPTGGPAVITNGTTVTNVYLGSLSLAEQLTGAEVRLTTDGTALRVAGAGTAFQGTQSGTVDSPPLWMYLYDRTLEDVTNAWDTWIGGGLAFDDEAFGNDLAAHPEVPQQVPALDEDGLLEFQNDSQLVPGRYRLLVESGNIGKTDRDFDGFAVEISVNNTVVPFRLLRGQNGYNIRGWDQIEFDLPGATTGAWLLTFNWTNSYRDDSKGVKRQLAVFRYQLARSTRELWKVGFNGATIVYENHTPVAGSYSSETGGGWLRAVTSDGTVTGQSHEVLVLPSNENGTSLLPLSDLLTGSSNNRRQDVIVTFVSGTAVVPEPPQDTFVFQTTITEIDIPHLNPPFWVWSGGLSPNPGVVVTAHLLYDAYGVRLLVSPESDLSDPIYSPSVTASLETNNRVPTLAVGGLEPWTRYYYALESNGSLVDTVIGQFTSFGTTAHPFSFSLTSDLNNVRGLASTGSVCTAIQARDPLFHTVIGNLYQGDIASNSVEAYRDSVDAIFIDGGSYTFTTPPTSNTPSTRQKALWQAMPVIWTWDDHDYATNDSDRTAAGRSAARAVYREYCPHYPLQAGGPDAPIYFSYRVGRCQFVVTDNRSERSPKTDADTGTKTMLGTTQKAWWKQQILQANGDTDIQFIFWVNSSVWSGTASGTADHWAGYSTERTELADFLATNGVTRFFILGGGMAATAIDDGRNADFATGSTGTSGWPVFQVGPADGTSAHVGGPYLIGPMPAAGTVGTQQFGVVTVYDYGSTAYLNVTAYDQNGTILSAAGTEMAYNFWGSQSPHA